MKERLIARFVVEQSDHFVLMTRFEQAMQQTILDKAQPKAPSLQAHSPSAVWFERKIYDDFGISFKGALDQRPLQMHEHIVPNQMPMRQSFQASSLETQPPVAYPYEVIGGETTYEISVGPIHAGIIEPGHFHFSQAGEHMLHQEVRHFYKWRGIEKMVEGMTLAEAFPIICRISGHSSIAYQWAWTEMATQASDQPLSSEQQTQAMLLLELERLAHHFTDLGFIPNDAGFGSALAWASTLAEQVRRQMAALTGHRFGFEAFRHTLEASAVSALPTLLSSWQAELERFEDWIESIPSLWDRQDTTGKLKPECAKRFDVVGVMARASGLARDVRIEQPIYQHYHFQPQLQKKGDVAARFRVRLKEAQHSLGILQSVVPNVATTPIWQPQEGFSEEYESRIESVLGELYLWMSLKEGRIQRFYIRDPSFVNWQALHLMMPNNIIADFPLINKSCDLSYAGNDL